MIDGGNKLDHKSIIKIHYLKNSGLSKRDMIRIYFLGYFFYLTIGTIFFNHMETFLPKEVHNWKILEPHKIYYGELIYDYMDGAGEVYLAYNFEKLLVQRYYNENHPEILVEIFDMQTSENAYGIFSNLKRGGKELNIGINSDYKNGLLCFWKGKYFIYLQVEYETEETKRAIIEIGNFIANSIKEKGEIPDLVKRLPEHLFIKNSIRYFYRNEILNLHYFVASENILYLDQDTRAILAQMKNDKSYLLVIKYPTKEKSELALNNFKQKYMPDAVQDNLIKTENNLYTAIDHTQNYLMIIFDTKSPDKADEIFKKIKRVLL